MIAILLGMAFAAPGVVSVEAHETALLVRLDPHGSDVGVVELLPHQDVSDVDLSAFLWRGDGSEEDLTVSRLMGAKDRLYSRFMLIDVATGEPIGRPRAVTEFPQPIGAFRGGVAQPESIKGVTCPVDNQDVIDLGTDWVDFGIFLNGVVDWANPEPEVSWVVDGREIGINMAYVRSMDAMIKEFSDAGLRVALIPVNAVPTEPQPENPTIHPRTNLAEAPFHLGAFNLTDHEGYIHFRAAIEFIAHRWGDPDGEHGFVSDYVIGNELQSHWAWNNMGEATMEDVVDDYVPALRVAWLACQKANPDLSVYISLDHCWNEPVEANPLHATTGKAFLERLNWRVKSEGPFPWNVAFHPYSEDLFNAAVWENKSAVLGFDSPRITFKNLEVLPAYLRQDRFLRMDKLSLELEPPRIILSEQGFHCADGQEGELLQAAAYAYAYERCLRIPEIDALILHRHMDHHMEAGLRFGLWSSIPDGKRMIYDVFRLADTDERAEAFEFALEVIGIDSWDEIAPAETVPEESGLIVPPLDAGTVVADLRAMAPEAEWLDTAGWRTPMELATDGRIWPALYHHPPTEPGRRVSTATFAIDLPVVRESEGLELQFATVISNDLGDGIEFAVLVEGAEEWAQVVRPGDPFEQVTVDLSSHAGQTVEIVLRVDSLGNALGDWANWLRPVVVRTSER